MTLRSARRPGARTPRSPRPTAAAVALAGRLEFSPDRVGELTLAVTEAATNLHKHARQGSMLLRITRCGDHPGIEMVTIDAGPGMPDTGAALRDGHSTSGTLGIGLGAISRLAAALGVDLEEDKVAFDTPCLK